MGMRRRGCGAGRVPFSAAAARDGTTLGGLCEGLCEGAWLGATLGGLCEGLCAGAWLSIAQRVLRCR
jgi:hypothetical protein